MDGGRIATDLIEYRLGGCCITANISALQAEAEGSTPSTRTKAHTTFIAYESLEA